MYRKNPFAILFLLMCIGLLLTGCSSEAENKPAAAMTDAEIKQKAQDLAQKYIIADGHIDLPYRLNEFMEDVTVQTPGGDFDYVRAKAGGLNAPFMSIYIPASYQTEGGAKEFADYLIDMVEKIASDAPDKFEVATSVADIKAQFKKGVVSLPMGIENGAPIEGKLENLQHFYDRGVRYITLTHGKANHICDSSYDEERKWNGLSPFGETLVAEMNRLGVMVDISHVSDSAFYDVMRITNAPAIASHSSCRHYTPGWERNMNDDMIKALAANGGVVCINFGSSFLDSTYQGGWREARAKMKDHFEEHNIAEGSAEANEWMQNYRKNNPRGTVEDVIKHIDHVVKLVGVDHVGFGSDFDGVTHLPKGAQDASEFPNIIEALIKRGYSDEDIEKICGGNLLRVWSEVEKIAEQSNNTGE